MSQQIAFMGLGAMGQRMVEHLITAGHRVTVWNRSPERTETITGAHVASSPAHAARGAQIVISMLRDDEASREVLMHPEHGALSSMAKGAHLIESSTLSVTYVRELATQSAERGVHFFDAPVAGTLPQAEAAQLIYFVGGDESLYRAQIESVLSHMGGAQHYCGDAGRGAAMKLAVNALFAAQVGVMAELMSLLDGAGFEGDRALDILASTPVCSAAAAGAARAMMARSYAPLFPIDLVEKDLRYALEACGAESMSHEPMMIAQAQRLFALAKQSGYGANHITGVRQVYS